MDNTRNLVMAVLLSALVLFGWQQVSSRFFPQPAPQAESATPAATPGAAPIQPKAAPRDRAAVIAATPRITIETPRLKGSINLKGAQIDDLVLVEYRQQLAKTSPAVRLLSPNGAAEPYFAGFGWLAEGNVQVPGADTLWTADRTSLTPTTPVTLRWSNPTGQTFSIRIAVDSHYMFSIDQSVANSGAGAIGVRSYSLISRNAEATKTGALISGSRDQSSWTQHVGPIGVFNAAANYDVEYSTLDEAGARGERFASKGGWLGFGETYWLTALAPAAGQSVDAGFVAGNGNYQADYMAPVALVGAGKSLTNSSHFFAGAKEVALLDQYETSINIALFGKAIDWGWFEVIEKPIFYLLDWLFKQVKNFGVAIILLTFLVRGLMFPIAQRQFASMAAMRVVQPKLKALQERYKDDKPQLQQEMMKLYKEEKINPMAGCLPIFLQIPIFYALYKVLMVTIEMRHQPFISWIKDLSAPDHLTPVNLFGLLDFTPPAMLAIGVLPILLGITMYLQFKLNPAPVDPVQAQIFSIMPWIMMFMMAPFASGLQLYWTTSNLLTIAQQKWLYSRHPALREPAKT